MYWGEAAVYGQHVWGGGGGGGEAAGGGGGGGGGVKECKPTIRYVGSKAKLCGIRVSASTGADILQRTQGSQKATMPVVL